jgi:hypothetical protein
MICQVCKDWGRTITYYENNCAISCPTCLRLTWPNLGVNIPAGAAVSMSNGRALLYVKILESFWCIDTIGPVEERIDSLALGIKNIFRRSLLPELALESLFLSKQQRSSKQRVLGYEFRHFEDEFQLHDLANWNSVETTSLLAR